MSGRLLRVFCCTKEVEKLVGAIQPVLGTEGLHLAIPSGWKHAITDGITYCCFADAHTLGHQFSTDGVADFDYLCAFLITVHEASIIQKNWIFKVQVIMSSYFLDLRYKFTHGL